MSFFLTAIIVTRVPTQYLCRSQAQSNIYGSILTLWDSFVRAGNGCAIRLSYNI